ncbi:MAG TPA: DUF4293 domain-containing protein [Bacteroidia bacterium]|nr:DUF4293 domain-containing protein [Bacteroidia bacterium]
MIQRIQSVYLFLITILSTLLFFFPFQQNIVDLKIISLKLDILNSTNTLLFIASLINLIILIDSLTIIFLFKNRKLQMKMCIYLAIMNLICLVLMYLSGTKSEGIPIYKLPFIIPVINIILSILAYRNIKKDEELVRSADRIR